jgi:hypothetical protein
MSFSTISPVYRVSALLPCWQSFVNCYDCTLFMIPEMPKSILGLLNSKPVQHYVSQIAPSVRGNYKRYKSLYNSQIPIPTGSTTSTIESLVEHILSMKTENPQANVSAIEREIDDQVYATNPQRQRNEFQRYANAVWATASRGMIGAMP